MTTSFAAAAVAETGYSARDLLAVLRFTRKQIQPVKHLGKITITLNHGMCLQVADLDKLIAQLGELVRLDRDHDG